MCMHILSVCYLHGLLICRVAMDSEYLQIWSLDMACLQISLCVTCRAMFGAGQGKYLTPHTTDRASDQWASGVVFNLMCLSQQDWRPAALLGIHMARASNPHHATQALRVFMRELECIMVYMEAVNFKTVNVTAVINKLLSSMLSSSLAVCCIRCYQASSYILVCMHEAGQYHCHLGTLVHVVASL